MAASKKEKLLYTNPQYIKENHRNKSNKYNFFKNTNTIQYKNLKTAKTTRARSHDCGPRVQSDTVDQGCLQKTGSREQGAGSGPHVAQLRGV